MILENIDNLIKKYKKTSPKRRTKKRPSIFPDTESEIDTESGVENEPEMHVPVIETDSEAPDELERKNQCERESESVVEVNAIDDDDESEPELNFRPSVIQPRELRINYDNLSPIEVTSSDDDRSVSTDVNNNDDIFVISSDSDSGE